ncbi:MAG: riboflavin synthase [Alphaproteobacteria bacterium GM202ARS2]|nr:riboflavin synthase [Alphaproteobacteria bacterium GM202ARS2]
MFSGIVSTLGRVVVLDKEPGGARLVIEGSLPWRAMAVGASVACQGVCLTVMRRACGLPSLRKRFWVMASAETLARTQMGSWRVGQRIHLEGALRLGDTVDGHLMFGHVDGLGTICRLQREGASLRMTARLPQELMVFMVVRGSVAIDGVSLTITAVDRGKQQVEWVVVPHTLAETLLGGCRVDDNVHVEVDMLARYARREEADDYATGT